MNRGYVRGLNFTERRRKAITTFNGLPSHVLLVHFIVVLAPLTALLAILSAVWPAARRRLVWLVLGLAVLNAVLTPITTQAGEWLERRIGRSPRLHTHTELGDTMLYFSIAATCPLLLTVRCPGRRAASATTVAEVPAPSWSSRARCHGSAGYPSRLGGAGCAGDVATATTS